MSGFPVFHNRWRSLQNGCRDEHGWQGKGSPISKTLHSFRRCFLVDRCSAQNLEGLGAVDHLGGDWHCYSWEDCWCRCISGHWGRIALHNESKLYLCSPRSANRGTSKVFSTTRACRSNTACTTGKPTALTMCCQLSSPRPAPVKPARPTQQGHRPPCGCTATVNETSGP